VLQDPLHLGGGEVGVDHESRLATDHAIELPRAQVIADAGGAPIPLDQVEGMAARRCEEPVEMESSHLA